ncbi:CRISPR-associated protein Csx16 [Pasteurella skyensis]|uniref:CRISPR-associated protein Csx16 n=1 Tax=Phocoenobacter skyensis TaxID=97481 RepID=A0AAJ6P1H9_9PAST|nr:CRISPR-associated protein Csx16 [Pasteurella skyensis]MDP8173655.1 CRISPR-associated protein Csx16 [Pasteurella skyensis]MDP8178023.1 CRISPR-associated protein Csx16 [Pasteurella skyensis]
MKQQIVKNATVITRHNSLIEYMKEVNLIDDSAVIISHATPEDVKGKDVIGILPHSLSCLTKTYTEVPLILPPEKRGVELTIEDVRKFAKEPTTFIVSII